jgi:hypothetical protein
MMYIVWPNLLIVALLAVAATADETPNPGCRCNGNAVYVELRFELLSMCCKCAGKKFHRAGVSSAVKMAKYLTESGTARCVAFRVRHGPIVVDWLHSDYPKSFANHEVKTI